MNGSQPPLPAPTSGDGPAKLPMPFDTVVSPRRAVQGLLRLLYTSNPFYAVSAVLVLFGLWVSFDPGGATYEPWALMAGITAYTLLLATTAFVLIRFFGVWDDARSLLLLVLLSLLAISVTFDEPLARRPAVGIMCYLVGLGLAIAVSEGLLRGLRISLGWLYRGPLYALLALFFVYPIALSLLIRDPDSERLRWAFFGFTPSAGLVVLSMLPAAWRGPSYVQDNGTPWRWPWFPCAPFAVLGFAVCVRSYYFCMSLHFVRGSANVWGPYFLVPFLLAAIVWLFEAARASASPRVLRLAMWMPALLILLGMTPDRADPVYRQFLTTFRESTGASPLFWTVLLSIAFYGYAAVRAAPFALDAGCVALAIASVVGRQTIDFSTLVEPAPWPLVAASATQLVLALWRFDSRRATLAACGAAAALWFYLGDLPWSTYRPVIVVHAFLAGILVVAAVFDDPFGRFWRAASAGMILALSGLAMWGPTEWVCHAPSVGRHMYVVLAALAALASGLVLASLAHRAAAWAVIAAWLATAALRGYETLRRHVVGLDMIAIGIVFFVCAAIVSLSKAASFQRWYGRLAGHSLRLFLRRRSNSLGDNR